MTNCYLAACAMVRDELDLREWAEYHLAAGFEHLIIYDNESRIPATFTLADRIGEGRVSVLNVRGRFQQCNSVYVDAIQRFERFARWIAFIDGDEYILPHEVEDVRLFLEPMEQFAAVGLNWQIFGDNGHVERPKTPLIYSYTRRASTDYWENRHVKSIVQPNRVLWPCNPHAFFLRHGARMVDPDGNEISIDDVHHQAFSYPPVVERIQINHYYTRSLEDFRMKQKRGGGAGVRSRADSVFTNVQEFCNEVEDTRIVEFLERGKGRRCPI